MSASQKKPTKTLLSNEEQMIFFNSHFNQYKARIELILKNIIQEELRQKSFDRGLKLRNMDVYRQLEIIRQKTPLDYNDVSYIASDVIPREPEASYIDQHKVLYGVLHAYRFVRDFLAQDKINSMQFDNSEIFQSIEKFAKDFLLDRDRIEIDAKKNGISKAGAEFCDITKRFLKDIFSVSHSIDRNRLWSSKISLPANDPEHKQVTHHKKINRS